MKLLSDYWIKDDPVNLDWRYLILPEALGLNENETGEYLVKLIKAWSGLKWENSSDININLALEAVYADFEGDSANLNKYVDIWKNEQKQVGPDLKVMHVYSKQEQLDHYREKTRESNFIKSV